MRSSLLLALAGCGGQAGSDYIGTWSRHSESRQANFGSGETVDIIRDTLTIERNGDGYLLHHKRTLTQGGDKPFAYPENKEPAVLKDAELQVAGGLGAYVLDKKTGHLVPPDGSGDYTRAGQSSPKS